MAAPQCENGHVRIADELFEAILQTEFSKRELLVVLAVIRKTYGWGKSTDRISSSQIAELTGIAPQHCRAALRELKTRRVIREADNEIGIQKDYEQWGGPKRAGPKQAGPKQAGKAAQNGPETRPKTGHTIDKINNRQKSTSSGAAFAAASEPEQVSPKTAIWNLGEQLLGSRAAVGQLIKTHGEASVFHAIAEAASHQAADPKAYIRGLLKVNGHEPSKHIGATSAAARGERFGAECWDRIHSNAVGG